MVIFVDTKTKHLCQKSYFLRILESLENPQRVLRKSGKSMSACVSIPTVLLVNRENKLRNSISFNYRINLVRVKSSEISSVGKNVRYGFQASSLVNCGVLSIFPMVVPKTVLGVELLKMHF